MSENTSPSLARLIGQLHKIHEATDQHEREVIEPARQRVADAEALIPAIERSYETWDGGRRVMSSKCHEDVVSARSLVKVSRFTSDGVRRSPEEQAEYRKKEWVQIGRAILAAHLWGERALRHLRAELHAACRANDAIGRAGGEILGLIWDCPVSSLEELDMKLAFLADEGDFDEPKIAADVKRLIRLSQPVGECAA